MFTAIFQQELTYWLRRPQPYFFGFSLFAIALLTMWSMAAEGTAGAGAEMMNSHYRINFMSNYLSLLLLFVLPAIVGVSIYRDYKSRMFSLLYAYPITKRAYLGAKFSSAFVVVLSIVLTIGLGFALATQLPGVNPEILLPFDYGAYVQLYLVYIIPNMLLFGLLVFLVVVLTRNIYVAFISMLLVLVLQALLGGLLRGADWPQMAALLDPTGDTAVKQMVQFWTVAERNTQALPISNLVIWNRLLWMSVAAAISIFTFRYFDFNQFAQAKSKRKPHLDEVITKAPLETLSHKFNIPEVQLAFTPNVLLANWWHMSSLAFRHIVWSWPFAALLLAGVLFVFFQQYEMNPVYGFHILPTTARMLQVPMFIFGLVINLLTFLYAGVLIHRDRMTRMSDLVDVSPQPNGLLLFARITAIWKMQLLLLLVVLCCGVLAQTFQGYFRYEIGHYLFELFVLQFAHFAIWACVAVWVHTLLDNLYLGFFALLLLVFGLGALPNVGDALGLEFLKESVLQFNAVPGVDLGFVYSDLSGYETNLLVYSAFKLYWVLAGLLLLILTLLAWKRGYTYTWLSRWKQVFKRTTGPLAYLLLGVVFAFVGMGAFLYHQEHDVATISYADDEVDHFKALNELRYGQYENYPQPKLCTADIAMDIYPDSRNFTANGTLVFVNKLSQTIDTILLHRSFKESTTYQVLNPHQVLSIDDEVNLDIILLSQGLERGDSLTLAFEVSNLPNTLLHNSSRVLANGTYITANILPGLGIRHEFLRGEKRAEYGLAKRTFNERMPTDTTLLGDAYAKNNMGRIYFRTIVGTAADQHAFAMGKLQKTWRENNRNYYEYISDGEIVNTISWMSGRYEMQQGGTEDLPILIYHHPDHGHNYEHLLAGLETSIAYCSKAFGELEHDTLRLVEFPLTYGTYATLNGNLIPYSEALFMADIKADGSDAFNLPFFAAAHEVAHYWWGHRVDPANVRGGRMITEGISEYLGIKALAQHFGPQYAQEFIAKMQRRYLRGRTQTGTERPLIYAGLNDEYLNYRKASIAFYALSQYLGEAAFTKILTDFEKAKRHTLPPYPTSLDFIDAISVAAADSFQYLIDDYFKHITLYDNEIKEVEITQRPDGQYTVDLTYRISKFRASAQGERYYADAGQDSLTNATGQHSLPLQDYIRIGLYGGQTSTGELPVIQLSQQLVIQQENQLQLIVKEKPETIILDPQHLLIDIDWVNDKWEAGNGY